jgi:outer membrane cobalamin receptor
LQACLSANTCQQVPYNAVRGQDFFQLDLRVSRTFRFGEKAKLDLIFQAFDLTNRANFGSSYGTSIRASNFEQPTGFITPSGTLVPKSFAAEFGARFSF